MHNERSSHSRHRLLQRYWSIARALTGTLLLAWFSTTFCLLFFARELSGLSLFGWPFSFYMAAHGLTLVYLLLVVIYVVMMRYLDRTVRSADHE